MTWSSPLEALTMGTLKPGAEDHGFVAAVEVIVPDDTPMAEESVTVPEVIVVAVLVTTPLEMVTISPAEEVTWAYPAVDEIGRMSWDTPAEDNRNGPLVNT